MIEEAGLKIGGYIGFQEDIQKNSETGSSVKPGIASPAIFDSFFAITGAKGG